MADPADSRCGRVDPVIARCDNGASLRAAGRTFKSSSSRVPSPPQLCDAMQRVPGNRNFNKRVEFCTVVRHYWGDSWYYASQVAFNLSLQASNIAAMIVSAQVIDNFFVFLFNHSWALDYAAGEFITSAEGNYTDPWGGTLTVISVGFCVSMAICIPFGWLNLDENMWFQWFSLVGLLAFTAEFLVQFVLNAEPDSEWHKPDDTPANTPVFNLSGQSHVLGVAVFSFAYVVTIPSWVNEKKQGVSVNQSIWRPATIAMLVNILVGILGAWAFTLLKPNGSPRTGSDNILNLLSDDTSEPKVTVYSAYIWNLTTMVPGIPVLAIMVRYNLLNGEVCGEKASFFFGVVAPWLVTAFCYQSQALVHLCNWVAILVQGFVNLVVPVALYRTALEKYPIPEDAVVGAARLRRDRRDNTSVNGDSGSDLLSVASEEALLPAESARFSEARVNPVPKWCCCRPRSLATFIIWFFNILCVAVIVVNVVGVVRGHFDKHK